MLAVPERIRDRARDSGGRVALAAWTGPGENVWLAAPGEAMAERGLTEPLPPGTPGPFSWAPDGLIADTLLAAGFAEPELDTVEFAMRYPGGVDEWTYDVIGRDTLRTALGAVDAFHLRPRMIGSPRGNFLMDIWYAPSLQYLPVRILVRKGDEAEIDLLVEAVDQR